MKIKHFILFTILLMFGQLVRAETYNDQLPNEPLLTGFEFESDTNTIKVSGEFELCNIPEITLNAESITPICTYDASEDSGWLLCAIPLPPSPIPIPYPNFSHASQSSKTFTKDFRESLLLKIYIDNENINISDGRLIRTDDTGFLPARENNASRWMQKVLVSLDGPTIHIGINLVAHELTHTVQQRSGDPDLPIVLGLFWNGALACPDL